ncbi:hypothetical protein [Streptomyces sp.]|uniref:hypothetical protein n=1 Tax=Streptomyces sp. TaxID=1931 RepID=UPI0025DF9FF7|nr:hypothetical protein [Streptomyces sp.]
MKWLRRQQIRPENYPNVPRYRLAMGLYLCLAVPLIFLNIFGPSTLHTWLSVSALGVFLVIDFGVLRRQ